MERKKIIIITLSSAALLILLSVFFFMSKGKQAPTTKTTEPSSVPSSSSSKPASFPVSDNQQSKGFQIAPSSNQDKSIITTPQGDKIEINAPEKIATEKLDPKDMVLKTASDYQIVYFNYSEGPSFLITLTSPNIEPARTNGEAGLLSVLGISKDQACKLQVSLTVPQDVSAKAAGYNYRLSFCPNGKALPK